MKYNLCCYAKILSIFSVTLNLTAFQIERVFFLPLTLKLLTKLQIEMALKGDHGDCICLEW